MSKNIEQLVDAGLLAKDSHQELLLRQTGTELETYLRRGDGSRIVDETTRLLPALAEADTMRRQALEDEARSHHSQRILAHLRDEGVIEYVRGGIDDRTRIRATAAGELVTERVIDPLFQAVATEGTLDHESREEYEQLWARTPTVDADYLRDDYRTPLRAYRDEPAAYRADVATVNRVDQRRNPWR